MGGRSCEQRLLNDYQRDFPLEPRPFARIAGDLGIAEDELLDLVADLQQRGVVGRVGAVVRPNTVGASTLAAVAAPEDRLVEADAGFGAVVAAGRFVRVEVEEVGADSRAGRESGLGG